jgi:hypothetical protein
MGILSYGILNLMRLPHLQQLEVSSSAEMLIDNQELQFLASR